MRIAMPSMPQSLAYSVVAATGVTFLIAVILLIYGDLVGGLLILTVAAAIYWLLGRNLVTIVTAGQVAASIALLCVVCALADLIVGFPYEAILFLLVAVALGFAFLLLHQGTVPIEVRFGRVIAVASPSRRSLTITCLPARASSNASPDPMPLAAPVMRTFCMHVTTRRERRPRTARPRSRTTSPASRAAGDPSPAPGSASEECSRPPCCRTTRRSSRLAPWASRGPP